MDPREILESNRGAIEALCRHDHVERLRIFGSTTRGSWNAKTSDFDFLVEYGPASQTLHPLDRLVGFQAELEALLGRNVDAVDCNAARNPCFRQNAEETAEMFYAA